MQDKSNDDHLRRTACRDFTRGQCYHPDCRFSHSILDCSRLIRLVRHIYVEHASLRAHLKLEYNAAIPSDVSYGAAGGMWSLSVQGGKSSRTVETENPVEAFKAIETQLNMAAATEDANISYTICNARCCTKSSACLDRHDLFDARRIEVIGKKLQSVGYTAEDSNVSVVYRYGNSIDSSQWHVTFSLVQDSNFRTEHVFADATLSAAVTVAEQCLSNIPTPDIVSVRTRRNVSAGDIRDATIRLRGDGDSPPSYDATMSTDLPHYNSVPESPYSSRSMHSIRAPSWTTSSTSPTSSDSLGYSTDVAVTSAIRPNLSFTCTRNRGHISSVTSSERRPLLQHDHSVHITYNAISHPRRDFRRSSPELWNRRSQDESTPLVLQFMALVMLSAISWVIIVVITLPCTEATC
ncbi:hypothetical protein BDY19DRAFT_988892 [Irpex rosettiformis]|uniref:Uncharacterized protein n=1 Tax=Irpex rosettiformis TaxID=378272 RepID=A0ACB8ULN5_9APHY|nr:hypothetical protein BDY19DRAFT_988892 [Irpex rosettiformis]